MALSPTSLSEPARFTMRPAKPRSRTQNVNAKLKRHFDNLCQATDELNLLLKEKADRAMAKTSRQDEKSPVVKREKIPPSSLTLAHLTNAELGEKEQQIRLCIYKQADLVGYCLGERLSTKYLKKEISEKLQGTDGYVILDLVPDKSSACWNKDNKSRLVQFFFDEIGPHLAPVEAIKPTYSQVSMRKVLPSVNEAPLTNAFLKGLSGNSNSLFPEHKRQSHQQLQTSAGIPVEINDLVADSKKYKNDALVLIEKNLKVKEKKIKAGSGFLECVPHLVSRI